MEEKWLPIQGYDGLYSVSNLGRVKSHPRYGTNKVNQLYGGGVLKTRKSPKSVYPSVVLWKNNVSCTMPVHRLVAIAFLGQQPEGKEVSHLDGNRNNNAANNLAWETHVENMLRRRDHGTSRCGEGSHFAKLTERRVRELKRRMASGTTHLELARETGISRTTLRHIRLGNSWAHV